MSEKQGTKVWCDVETTGTRNSDEILEIAVVITDDDHNILGSMTAPIGDADVSKIDDPYVQDMHEGSGLLEEIRNLEPGTNLRADIEQLVCELILTYCEPQQASLAGNSIKFDHRMLSNNMPKVLDVLHYRTIDVSSLRREFRDRTGGAVEGKKPDCPHRALGDVLACMKEHKDLFEAYDAWVIEKHMAEQGQKGK